MPLIKSASRSAIGKNILTEQAHGKPHKQAVAIALNTARKAGASIPMKKATGGIVKEESMDQYAARRRKEKSPLTGIRIRPHMNGFTVSHEFAGMEPSKEHHFGSHADVVTHIAKHFNMGGKVGYAEGGSPKKWIAGAIKHPGALHKQLGVPAGKKIPAKKLEAAEKKPGLLGKRARLAETLKSFHK